MCRKLRLLLSSIIVVVFCGSGMFPPLLDGPFKNRGRPKVPTCKPRPNVFIRTIKKRWTSYIARARARDSCKSGGTERAADRALIIERFKRADAFYACRRYLWTSYLAALTRSWFNDLNARIRTLIRLDCICGSARELLASEFCLRKRTLYFMYAVLRIFHGRHQSGRIKLSLLSPNPALCVNVESYSSHYVSPFLIPTQLPNH